MKNRSDAQGGQEVSPNTIFGLVCLGMAITIITIVTIANQVSRARAINEALDGLATLARVTNMDDYRRQKSMRNHPAGKGRTL